MKNAWKIIFLCLALPALATAAKSNQPLTIETQSIQEPRALPTQNRTDAQRPEPISDLDAREDGRVRSDGGARPDDGP